MEGSVPDSGILDQVQSLVIDASQVVSYKWLSRNFSVSSNVAKRILQEFAKQNEGNKVEVVYAVSGWSKSEPSTYTVQLVPKAKLQDALLGLDGSASHHVYSVQPCLTKDPAQLFSAEFVQAQELFMQPRDIDNCLRDNRFSSVSYSLVIRNAGGSKPVVEQQKAEPSSSVGVSASSKHLAGLKPSNSEPQVPQSTSLTPTAQKETDVKNTLKGAAVVNEEGSGKSSATTGVPGKAVAENVATGKKKVGMTVGGGSLANLWGRAPAKVKADTPQESKAKPALVAGDAEAGIRAMEADGNESRSDGEGNDFARIRRCQAKNGKGRKRQVVFDEELSEDDEIINSQAAINLASPEPFKKSVPVETVERQNVDTRAEADFVGPTGMEIDEEKGDNSSSQPVVVASTPEKAHQPVGSSGGVKREAEIETEILAKPHPGPKRKKVLKTRIDNRGREVTEVVWETDGVEDVPEAKPAPVPDKVPAPLVASKVAAERATAPSKPPQKTTAKAPAKTGGKAASKGQGQGPGQGSLLSFFKKK